MALLVSGMGLGDWLIGLDVHEISRELIDGLAVLSKSANDLAFCDEWMLGVYLRAWDESCSALGLCE